MSNNGWHQVSLDPMIDDKSFEYAMNEFIAEMGAYLRVMQYRGISDDREFIRISFNYVYDYLRRHDLSATDIYRIFTEYRRGFFQR